MPVIFHVTTAAEWEAAKEKGAYTTHRHWKQRDLSIALQMMRR